MSKALVAQMGSPRSSGPWGVAGRLEQQESRILAAGAGELLSLGRICRLVRELFPCSSFSRAATLLGRVFALSMPLLYQALVLVSRITQALSVTQTSSLGLGTYAVPSPGAMG